MHSTDAMRLGLEDGGLAWVESRRAAVCARVNVTDDVRPGLVSLPHGYGMFEGPEPNDPRNGPAINFLTDSRYCDSLSKVPFHKHVRVRVAPVSPEENVSVGELREASIAPA